MAQIDGKATSRGQIAIQSLLAVGALLAAVAAPILWVGDIKEVNAVQDNKINNIENQQMRIETQYTQLNNKLDALLLSNGIDPNRASRNSTQAP